MGKLRPAERVEALRQVTHASNWPESWCKDPGFLIPSRRLSLTQFTSTPLPDTKASCSEPGQLLRSSPKRRRTVTTALSALPFLAGCHVNVNLRLCDPGRVRTVQPTESRCLGLTCGKHVSVCILWMGETAARGAPGGL